MATLRAPTLADAPAAAAVVNDYAVRLTGSPDVAVDDVRGWWTQPAPFELARDALLAEEDGTVVGYADLGDQANDGKTFWLDVRGEAHEELLAELERRARERAAHESVVRAVPCSQDTRLQATLAGRGYSVIRASYRMQVELGEGIRSPSWPTGVSVREARRGEEQVVYAVHQESFRDHWNFTEQPYDEWRHWLLETSGHDASLWFVAEAGGEIVGIALCRPQGHGDPSVGWVAVLGVLPAWRGQGIGLALLLHAFGAFAKRSYPHVALGVDAENTTGAVGLYERAGMHVVQKFEIWEKQL
jgi:mycothiol synthase